MRLSDHQAAFTWDLMRLIYLRDVAMPGYRIRILEVGRDVQRQQYLIDNNRSWVENPATAPHVEKRAADLALDKRTEDGWEYLSDSEDYRRLGEAWESFSPYNRWGGRFGDGNHFERMKVTRQEVFDV